jgi:hypothetical protein
MPYSIAEDIAERMAYSGPKEFFGL